MHKKTTALLAIIFLSAQAIPVFAQDPLCDLDQQRLAGQQVTNYLGKTLRYARAHRDDICGSPFLTSPLQYVIWKIQRNGEKAKIEQQRNKKTIVSTKSYEMKNTKKSQNKSSDRTSTSKKGTKKK